MPAAAAFWTSSKLTRPLTSSTVLVQRQRPGKRSLADELVEGVVAPDILAQRHELAVRRKQAGRVEAASGLERLLRRAQCLGQRAGSSPRHVGPSGSGSQRRTTSSMLALPQIPQLAVATVFRAAMLAGSSWWRR